MFRIPPFLFIPLTIYLTYTTRINASNGLCSVFDPFKVQPDGSKYQIGGAFPLHYPDCSQLCPEVVQDIVAIQWALTHWNQNPANSEAKIGLFAGDTCSRPKEAISQSLRFLDSIGYHEPDECTSPSERQNISKLLGLIMPKDEKSSRALSTLLNSAELPIATYSSSSSNTLAEMKIKNVITTAPTLTIFIEAFVKLMANLRSNLVAIVINERRKEAVKQIVNKIKAGGIFISDVVSISKPGFLRVISESDSQIILSFIDKQELFTVLSRREMTSLDKMWIAITADGDGLSSEEQLKVLHKGSRVQVISLQSRQKDLPQFRDYFLKVLKNNYQSYSLLASYMQQVHNCSVVGISGYTDCAELTRDEMNLMHKQASTVESVVRMTIALAAVGAKLRANPASDIICDRPSPKCTGLIVKEVESLDYEFGANDPPEFSGERLQFYRSSDGHLVSSGIMIEGIELVNDEKMGPMVYKVIEYETGRYPRLVANNFRQSRLRSVCAPYRPFCGRCEHITQVDPKRYFLSLPKQYPLYLMALFNFHDGNKCQLFKNYDISLPMAFVHTIWTFRQRFPQLNLLRNLEFGALLVDSCTSSKRAIEIIVQSENQCFAFEQANRNITIVPGSIFGYVSGLHGGQHEALSGFFATGEVPLIALDSDRKPTLDEFSTMPSGKYQALALLKLLKKLKWEFISVVLSEQDSESLASFRHFERMAADRGVCLAEVINMSGEHLPEISASSATNTTVLFTTADDAAIYFAARLKRESSLAHAHVVVGDAHDFYLRDPSNVAKFVGTDVLYADFRQWLEMTTPLTLPENWYWKHVEHRWQCALSDETRNLYGGKMCTGEELLDIENLGRMTKSGYLSRGVEKLLFAMDSVYKKLCPEQKGLCPEFYISGRKQILNVLKKVHIEDEFEIYEFLPDSEGAFSYQVIGNWSIKTGLRFGNTFKNFNARGEQIPSELVLSQRIVSRCVAPLCSCFIDKDFFTNPMQMAISSNSDMDILSGSYVRREPANGGIRRIHYENVLEHLATGNWRDHIWNYIFLLLNSLLLFASLAVLALVCIKLYLRVVKGNQSLGISLLIGIILLYVTTYFFIFDPTDMICRARVTMHSLGYTLCFGVMIAKATQLRNAETLGFSTTVHISYWNYWLLLFFILGVQIALSVRWLAEQYMSTLVLNGARMQMACAFGNQEFLLSQTYVIVLLALALFVNSRNRNIKRNYKETKWLFLASVVCVFLWTLWMSAYLIVPPLFRDMVVVFELMACATVMLGFLFGPKIYILLSYEPVVVEYQGPNVNKDLMYENGLFEKDNEIARAISPTSSTGSGAHSTTSGVHRSVTSIVNSSSSGACSDDQVPIFHTVMRKKNKVRRSRSEHSVKQGHTVSAFPSVPASAPILPDRQCETSVANSAPETYSKSEIVRHGIRKQCDRSPELSLKP